MYLLRTFLIVFVSLIVQFPAMAQSLEEQAKKADQLLDDEKYEEAINLYNKLLKEQPNSVDFLRGRGYAYLETDQIDAGEKDYQKALKLDPTCYNCYNHLSRVALVRGDMEKGMELVSKAIEIHPDSSGAYILRAVIKEYQGRTLSASSDYDKAIRLDPNNAVYYSERARYNFGAKMIAAALLDYNMAIELDSTEYSFWYGRARLYASQEKWEFALTDMNKAVELISDRPEAYESRAIINHYLEDYEAALSDYNKAISLDGKNASYYMNRALTRYKLEDMEGNCEDNRKALELLPATGAEQSRKRIESELAGLCDDSKSSYYYQRGIAAFNREEYEQAVEHYNAGIKKFPESAFLISFRGNAWLAAGEPEKALSDYDSYWKLKDKLEEEMAENQQITDLNRESFVAAAHATVLGSTAEAKAGLGQYEEALTAVNKSIKYVEPFLHLEEMQVLSAPHHNMRGVIHNAMGKTAEAKKDFQRAIELDPRYAAPHFNLAVVALAEAKVVDVKTIQSSFFVTGGLLPQPRSNMQSFKYKKSHEPALRKALEHCNRAITLYQESAFGYLLRARLKQLLNEPDYCLDVATAQSLGVEDALQQFGGGCGE